VDFACLPKPSLAAEAANAAKAEAQAGDAEGYVKNARIESRVLAVILKEPQATEGPTQSW
jgi:hypothetical protein